MAAGEAAVALPPSSPPASLVLRDGSSSNMSSPLSDVEDKDADSDVMDLDLTDTAKSKANSAGDVDVRSNGAGGNDDESNLSEVETNDSEAETERLYDSPTKNNPSSNPSSNFNDDHGGTRYADLRDRVSQPSPSKLKQQSKPVRDSLTGEVMASTSDQEETETESSVASGDRKSTRESLRIKQAQPQPPNTHSRDSQGGSSSVALIKEVSSGSASDNRKRKRSPAVESIETAEHSVRKRLGSATEGVDITDETGTVNSGVDEAEAVSTNPESGAQSDDEASSASHPPKPRQPEIAARPGRLPAREIANLTTWPHLNGSKKSKDSPGRDQRSPRRGKESVTPDDGSPASGEESRIVKESEHPDHAGADDTGRDGDGEGDVEVDADGDGNGDNDGDGDGDGDSDGDGDGDRDGDGDGDPDTNADVDMDGGDGEGEGDDEPEMTQKDMEEMQRRKAAQVFILSLEKSFAGFRDQYYEERLRLLNEEEAMLTANEPTHPEYLAMMQCVDARRDEKLRIIETEYRFSQEALQRWAVARRSQIMSHYYQSVRESREKILDELGNEWYRIQQQRRRHANHVADFTLQYPDSRAKALRQAIAYNKEVSILSGIAKHRGFPGAPEIKGATSEEIEDDLDEIVEARREAQPTPAPAIASLQDYGAIPNERALGPAGAEFLKQTPWANPNHPAHRSRLHQLPPQENPQRSSPASGPYRGNSHNSNRPHNHNVNSIQASSSPTRQKSSSAMVHDAAIPVGILGE